MSESEISLNWIQDNRLWTWTFKPFQTKWNMLKYLKWHQLLDNLLLLPEWFCSESRIELVKCLQQCAQSLPEMDLDSLPTSQLVPRHSSFMVNFTVAHEHTAHIFNPKNLLVWETNPSQGSKNIENTLVPILAQDREVLEPSEGLKLKDGIGRKNIHWSSVFL